MSATPAAGMAVAAVPYVRADSPHPYWTLTRVAQALGTGPRSAHALAGVSTDTRTLKRGDCFVALKGENYDAHDFLGLAKECGAAAFVVSNAKAAVGLGLPTYIVHDTLVALGQLATAWRRAWNQTVVAVAGSNGKTSTKDMLRAALSTTMVVHATTGNMNNLVGVPLTLLAIPPHAELAVVELGTNAPGEVARLRAITEPNIAVLTSIGEEHLEGLGDLAGVLREECDVFQGTSLAVVPSAFPDAVARAAASGSQVVRVGLTEGDVVPSSWGLTEDGRGWLTYNDVRIELPLRGAHQVANATLVLAVARACGVSMERVAVGIGAMPVPNMRGVWVPLGEAVLINDAYNANPPSMRAALALLDNVVTDHQRVAILGSMRELGSHGAQQHEDIARVALASKANLIVGIGDFAAAFQHLAPHDARVLAVSEFEAVWPQLEPRLAHNAVILLKASRGAKLERLVPFLTAWATS